MADELTPSAIAQLDCRDVRSSPMRSWTYHTRLFRAVDSCPGGRWFARCHHRHHPQARCSPSSATGDVFVDPDPAELDHVRGRQQRREASSRISTPSSVTGTARELVERLLVGLAPLLASADLLEFGRIGIDEDLAGRAVDGDERAGRDDGRWRCAGRRRPGRESSARGSRCGTSSCRRR